MNNELKMVEKALVSCFLLSFPATLLYLAFFTEPKKETVPVVEEVIKETPPTTIFNVDGVTCWVGNYPVITYDTSDQTVSMRIVCGVEVLDHHLPAIERTQ